MNWIPKRERYPDVAENGLSEVVLIWIKDGQSRRGKGFAGPALGYYNQKTGHWHDSTGSITERGWIVTHWAVIEEPTEQ